MYKFLEAKKFFLLFIVFIIVLTLTMSQILAAPQITKDGTGLMTYSGLTVVSYGGYLNGESFQQDGVTTYNNYQYTAFWNTNRNLIMARRKLPNGQWQKFEFSDYFNSANDAHNTISLGICPNDGTLHIAFDHHGSDLNYRKSVQGLLTNPDNANWSASSFSSVTHNLTGNTLNLVTYPRFITTPQGNMLFEYRYGSSGSGDQCLYEYNGNNHNWTNIGKYIDGINSSINAYPHNLYYGKNSNRLHMAWCWRETPDASTNFDLLYIYSDDNGRTWKNNSGNTVAISGNSYITKNTSGLKVWTINKNRGLINQEHMTVDNQGNVHVLLSHMPDSQPDDSNFTNARTKSSYFHYWRDNKGNWQRNSLSLPSIQNFRGKLAASNSGNLYAVLPDLRIASASYETKWTDWKLISNEYSGKFFSDPLIDTNRLKIENKLSIIYPEKNSPNIHYLDYSLDVGYTTTTLPTETPNNSDKSWISSNVFAGAIFDIGNFNDSLNIEFDVTPYSNNIDGVIGYADKSTKIDSYSAMPILVRMNPSGYFDVRNGDSYAENQKIYYSANTTYHVKIMAKIKERLYDVWVNNTQIASNYKFRNDSPIIDDIGQVCLISTADKAFKVDNHTKNSNTTVAASNKLPDQNSVLNIMKLVNDYWISGHSDGGNNSWNNAVYHTGNMSLFKASQDLKYYNYSLSFSNKLNWLINSGNPTRNADQQCVGQTFLNLYQLKKDEQKITNIKSNIDAMVNSSQVDDWWWIDAMYMAMPIFTKLGVTQNNTMYFDKMYALYSHNRNQRGLYDTSSHLWYRDENFKYPAKSTTNGKKNFWSRGNGWVFSAMVKVLEELPKSNPNYNEYKTVFQEMATALKDRQRSDGFWNVSLDDPDYYGGCETSGTSAFTYGIAWGINNGYLDSNTYKPVVVKAWNGLVNTAVHYNGKLGYIQGIGDQPSSSQPVTFDSTSDFGVGLFLNAGSEVIKLCDDYKVPINVSIP